MKSLNILRALLHDASLHCDANTDRDWITIQSRFQTEGLSFLTITLPRFSNWLEQSLEEGHVLPTILTSFKKKPESVAPCFLQGLTGLVFDLRTGLLREDADASAIFYIRQICSFWKKVKLPCTPARDAATLQKFCKTDEGLPLIVELDNVTKSVCYVVLASLEFSDSHELCLPKHGPGATVERLWGNQKYEVRQFYARWKGVFDPVDLYGSTVLRTRDITLVQGAEEKACRLSLVPKTQKSSRTIACEPTAMQYAQQYIGARLIAGMKSSPYTRHIKFKDQSVNQTWARRGSITRSIATIDLSEASDRISVALVQQMFQSDPDLLKSLEAVRSHSVTLPDGSDFRLRKFSTSGSAITFPLETLIFFILALSAVVKSKGPIRDLVAEIHHWAPTVSVFGDDIVVPVDACGAVVGHLESFGLKVNRDKTFSKGFFRESCGGDFWKGHNVTPKYLREHIPDNQPDIDVVQSIVSTGNQLFFAGCWRAADWMREYVDSRWHIPLVSTTSPGAGWHSHRDIYEFTRFSKTFMAQIRTVVVRTKPVENPLDGVFALLKHLISTGVQEDSDHLLQSVPKYRSSARLMWTTPY